MAFIQPRTCLSNLLARFPNYAKVDAELSVVESAEAEYGIEMVATPTNLNGALGQQFALRGDVHATPLSSCVLHLV